MTLAESLRAAATAIATHTAAARVDDAGDPAGVGMWHLLSSLEDAAAIEGYHLDDLAWEVRRQRQRLYLVTVVPGPRDVAVVVASPNEEHEVVAMDLADACAQAVGINPRNLGNALRRQRTPYTGEYVEPDMSAYAGSAMVLQGDASSLGRALAKDVEVRKASRPEAGAPAAEWDAAGPDPVDAARLALAPFAAGGPTTREAMRGLVEALMDYAEAAGEDIDAMVLDVVTHAAAATPC